MKSAPYVSDVKTSPGLRPFIKKVIPQRIIKIYQDYTIGQYTMIFVYTALAMGAVFVSYVVITRYFI